METSALSASNVENAFVLLVTSIYHKKMPKVIASTAAAATVSMNTLQPPTIPVDSESTIIFDEPIRPSHNEKRRYSKKNDCCVIS